MSTPLRPRTTTAFFTQSVISFAVSLGITITGIGYLHDSRWIRGFLALGLLYVVTSSFTLAKCVRDRQEETALVSRVDQARAAPIGIRGSVPPPYSRNRVRERRKTPVLILGHDTETPRPG